MRHHISHALAYFQQVARVIAGRMHDPSRLVRAEALDMLGRNIQSFPRLLVSYFDLLLSMVRDEGVMVRKKAVAIFRELFLSGSLQPERVSSTIAEASENVMIPILLPPANGRSVRALLALLQRSIDPREEESIRDALQSMFEEIWFGVPRAAQRGSVAWRGSAAAPDVTGSSATSGADAPCTTRPSRVVVKANCSAVTRADVSGVSQLVAQEIVQRTSQLVSLIDATSADGRAADWIAELLRRLLSPHASVSPSTDATSDVKVSRRSAAATGHVVPGIGLWSPVAAGSAFVNCIVSSLQQLAARRSAILALQERPSGADTTVLALSNPPGTASVDACTAPLIETGPTYVEARALYERELVAGLTVLRSFAKASPALLSPHVHVLAPFLRGDALLLSASGNAVVLQRSAALVELAVPLCSPPADASFVDSIVADLVHLVQV